MGIKLGIVGTGAFAQSFIPLFQAHPLVDELTLCDLDAGKLQANAARYGIERTSPSLDALLETDVDAVAIITQHWLHAGQAIQALRAGKHAYSAVPTGMTQEEVTELVRTVEGTGLIYMLGETSYYYPEVIYCRQQYQRGAFGRVVYGEAEYYHDWDHGLYDVYRWRAGEQWRREGGVPPMYYPTHSISEIVSVTGAHMTHVSCQGFVDTAADGVYGPQANRFGNSFSNEMALFRMSDGSTARVNEFRRVGHPGTVRMSLWGTEGSFEHNAAGAVWVTKDTKKVERLDELLDPSGITRSDGRFFAGLSALHPVARLPEEFAALPSGHAGSHAFLVDDFVVACARRTRPAIDVWQAARYCMPGLVAHDSAANGGILLAVPDLGPGPT